MKLQMKSIMMLFITGYSLLLAACTGNATSNKVEKQEKPIITVTIEPQRYFTEAIAGDKFEVVSMVPKGVSPETYDPVPQQLVSLRNSEAYLRIGHIGFERVWMDKLMDNTPHIQVFDTSKGVDFIFDEHHHCHHEGKSHGEPMHGIEPHIWSSTTNALIIAGNTFKALSQLDKENTNYYMARYDSLCHRIMQVDSLIHKQLSAPTAAKTFMIYHPALSYFARDYGLQQIPIEEGGKEPSPAHLKALIDLCKASDVRVIFVQPEFDQRNAETIMKQTGTRIVSINPLNYAWEEEMLNITQALTTTEQP